MNVVSCHHTLSDLLRARVCLELSVVYGRVRGPRPLERGIEVVSPLQEPGAGIRAGSEYFLGPEGTGVLALARSLPGCWENALCWFVD